MDEQAALKKPVILIVDDEVVPLKAVAKALAHRYNEN
jgi:hypothetical protein